MGLYMKNEIRMENGIKDGVFYFANLLNLKDGKFVVPSGVKSLKEAVFATHSMLEEVVLPEGLEQIGFEAFRECKNLEKINIPSTVTTIYAKAFSKCEKLKEISLPKGITKIEPYTFLGCGLENVTIFEGVTNIDISAFADCYYLKNITFPNTLQEIGHSAFCNCERLNAISLPSEVKTIQPRAFYHCYALKNVEIAYGLEQIGIESFESCKNLKKVNIPNSVEYIGPHAFKSCHSLEEIKLSESLTEIEACTFKHCWGLQSITIPNNVKIINFRAFEDCTKLEHINFGEGLRIIEENAFRGCKNLISITMPKNLQQIKEGCFANCEWLHTVKLNNNLRVIEDGAFDNCNSLKEINLPDSILEIGQNAFTNCRSLEKIILPQNLKILPRQVFSNCENLKIVQFNEGLEEILIEAFVGCENLEYVKLPKSLRYLGRSAFLDCKNLKTIEISSENIKEIGYGVFKDCESLENIIIDGKEIKVSQEIINNFSYIFDFLVYASKNNKFLPKNVRIMNLTNRNEIENYYSHSKEWKNILNSYLKEWQPVLIEHGKLELDQAIANLYQVSIAMGLFAGGEDTIRAKEFLNNVVVKMCPQTIHMLYGSLDTKENGYIKEYADFYIKNFYGKTADGLHLLERVEVDDSGEEGIVNYTASAYNNWDKVKKAYPNRTVLAHREHGSENNNLTEEDIFNALHMTYYENVDEDNEEMAEIVGKYGYSQKEFEELQEWYNIAKKLEPKDVVLNVGKDNETSGVTFELLEKGNAEALILGEKTNCCQTVNDAGSSCVEYGITKPNSGFVKFMYNDKIVGQSWVWYNEKTGIVCLDNIEVPTIWQKEMHKKEFQTSFINCIKRIADSFKQEMEKNGHKVRAVTIGSGYNDLQGIDTFERKQTSKTVLPEDYNGYSDATSSWYVVPTMQKKLVKEEKSK